MRTYWHLAWSKGVTMWLGEAPDKPYVSRQGATLRHRKVPSMWESSSCRAHALCKTRFKNWPQSNLCDLSSKSNILRCATVVHVCIVHNNYFRVSS